MTVAAEGSARLLQWEEVRSRWRLSYCGGNSGGISMGVVLGAAVTAER